MSVWLVETLSTLMVGALVTWLVLTRGDGHSLQSDENSVTVGQPRARARQIRALAVGTPILVLVALLLPPRSDDLGATLVMVGLAATGTTGFFWIAALEARRIVVSAEGLVVVGFRGWRMPWSELAEIRAVSPGLDVITFVSTSRRKITLVSTFDGWAELMSRLAGFVRHDPSALSQVRAALRELNRWKNAGERYPM